jgi:hypothetical protein
MIAPQGVAAVAWLRLAESVEDLQDAVARGYSLHAWSRAGDVTIAEMVRDVAERLAKRGSQALHWWAAERGLPTDGDLEEAIVSLLAGDDSALESFLDEFGYVQTSSWTYHRRLPGLCALCEAPEDVSQEEALALAREAAADLGGPGKGAAAPLLPVLALLEGELVGWDRNGTDGRPWPLIRPTRVLRVWETGEFGRREDE